MKHTHTRGLLYAFIAVAALGAAALSGCSEDSTGPDETGSDKIVVESIILNPKSPEPGDTLQATAVVTSSSTNPGDFVQFSWSATGGTFLEADRSTVRWVAPDTSRVFTISVSASNSVSTSARSENIFVSRIIPFVPADAGGMRTTPGGDAIYYLSSPVSPGSEAFRGFTIRLKTLGSDEEISGNAGIEHAFSRDFSRAAYVREFSVPPASNNLLAIEIFDLQMRTPVSIPNTPFLRRAPEYTEPSFSPDGTLLAYQVFLPDQDRLPVQGGVDTFVVAVWDVAASVEKRVAVQSRSFHPTFSTDGSRLVYVSDPAQPLTWEIVALPVQPDGTIEADSVSPPLPLTSTGGLMGGGEEPANLAKAWNPVSSVLATLDKNKKLWLVPADGSGATIVSVGGKVNDFAWAPSGQSLVMSATATIVENGVPTRVENLYRVDLVGNAQAIHQAPGGDVMSRLSWSPGGEYIVYNVRRLNDDWYELLDAAGALGLPGPLRITPSDDVGNADDYSALGSIRPVWAPAGPTAYLLFFGGSSTPKVCAIGFGGLGP